MEKTLFEEIYEETGRAIQKIEDEKIMQFLRDAGIATVQYVTASNSATTNNNVWTNAGMYTTESVTIHYGDGQVQTRTR